MTMRLLLLACGLCLSLGPVQGQREGYCLSTDYEPYLMFATKTAYEIVKGRESNQHQIPYCRAIQFWSYNRHGTRLPSAKGIDELPKLARTRDDIVANYEIRRTAPDQGRLCQQDLENLKLWFWNRNYTKNFANDLTVQGFDDLKFLAKRWQTKFPDLLPPTYSPRHFEFRYTEKRRTKDSYRAFLDGLFGKDAANNIRPPQVILNDTLLQPYEFCTEWVREVGENPRTLEQSQQFMKKEEYTTMIQNVSSHLGYKYPLEESVVDNIYDMCRYNKAWELQKNSPWCAAFNKDQLRLMEYAKDLKDYYLAGYGSKLNKKIGCTPIKDFMAKFTRMVEHPEADQPKAVVYFTHSQMLQTLVTAMGAFEDHVPLTSDNYHTSNIQARKWRTSLIDPFASNLAAVLYKCEQGESHQVMFFLNEKPMDFSECRVGLCSWEMVKAKFGAIADSCNLEFCSKNSASAPAIGLQALVSLLLLSLLTKYTF